MSDKKSIKFKYDFIESIFKRARLLASDKDTYNQLLTFEKFLQERLNWHDHTEDEIREIKRTMALIDLAEIQCVERDLQIDIDGDGKIGGRSMCIRPMCNNIVHSENVFCPNCETVFRTMESIVKKAS